MEIKFTTNSSISSKNIVLLIPTDLQLGDQARNLNKELCDLIEKTIKVKSFNGKKEDLVSLTAPASSDIDNIFLIGVGDKEKITDSVAKSLGSKIFCALKAHKLEEALIITEKEIDNISFISNITLGILLRSYSFNKYKTKENKKLRNKFKLLTIATNLKNEVENEYHKKTLPLVEAVFFTRDLVSEPSNVLYPETYSEIIKSKFSDTNVNVKILSSDEMEKMGMGALLGVAQGSSLPPKLVVMEWYGDTKNSDVISFVGKGVTFDSGGISIKPSANMGDMKYDMGGSAVVVGLMRALSARNAKVNAIGIVGLVENMPDGNAQRPGDVVTSMSGKTIEVLNTDAEGRLVLADALSYCQKYYNPKVIIDLATLTGAIVIALGNEYAGLFSNDEELTKKLRKAGKDTEEKLWPLPIGKTYDKMLDSPIADMQNISNARGAGSITAAQFLNRFIEKDTKWAHLDIAGVTWANKNKDICPKGATGFGVQMLNKFVEDNYEN